MTAAANASHEPLHLPLQLRPAPLQASDPAPLSYLIPGGDPELWLRELCAWGVPLHGVELLVIPVSAREPAPLGLFVILPESERMQSAPSAIAQPYRKVGGNLYVPADSIPHPPMTDAELRGWLLWDVQVLHPTVGMIGCSRGELLRVADLLSASPPAAVDWDRALPGVAVDARVRSVRPDSPPAIEQFLDESQDDIGSAPPQELPPLPNESPLARAAAKSASAAFGALKKLTKLLGGAGRSKPATRSDAGQPREPRSIRFGGAQSGKAGFGWVRRLHEWAKDRHEALTRGLEEARQRELTRLMKMLESDPDRGLRYALPLHDTGTRRGRGHRGGALTPRDTNFSFGSLFSSGPGDPWNMRPETYQRLRERYHQLASRELNLGRHRRAAYIFAQLLGDYAAAANALKQGRFFREAATLYRDQLRNAEAAAVCLEEGGLLNEAIDEYAALKRFEKVGDLERRLEHHDLADAAYRRAVATAMERSDVLDAARLLEAKLGAVDESLAALTDAWPARPQAAACLRASFELLGRVNRHDEAARRLHSLRREPNGRVAQPLANVLADVAGSYPSLDVRRIAADATRVVAGRRLSTAEPTEVRALTGAVARVAVEDRLLPRDVNRYVERVTAATAKVADPRPARPRAAKALAGESTLPKVSLKHAFILPPVLAQWRTAVSDGSTFYAQGIIDERLIVVQGTWTGQTRYVAWRDPHGVGMTFRLEPSSATNLLAVPRHGVLVGASAHRLAPKDLFSTDVSVGVSPLLGRRLLYDVACDDEGLIWVLHAAGTEGDFGLVLSAFDQSGHLRWSGTTPVAKIDEDAIETVFLRVRNGYACVTHGSAVHVLAYARGADHWLPPIDLGRPVRSVGASPPHTRARFAISLEEGGRVLWADDQATEPFGASLLDPAACITAEGMVAAVGRNHGVLYRMSGKDLSLASPFAARVDAPIAVTPAPGGFASFYSDGLVQVMTCA